MDLLFKKLGIDTRNIETTKTPWIYLLAITAFIFVLKSGLLVRLEIQHYGHILIPFILCIMGLTIGSKDIDKYLNWNGGTKQNLSTTAKCWLLSSIVTFLVYLTQGINADVQQLGKALLPLSQLSSGILGMMLTGIGEEFFKFLCFITIFTLLTNLKLNKTFNIICGILLSSLLFGALHINYNMEMWLIITLGLGLGACVQFYFLFKYKTIVPLIIAHAFQDILNIMLHTEQIRAIVLTSLELVGVIIGFAIILKGLFQKSTR